MVTLEKIETIATTSVKNELVDLAQLLATKTNCNNKWMILKQNNAEKFNSPLPVHCNAYVRKIDLINFNAIIIKNNYKILLTAFFFQKIIFFANK